MDDGQSPGSWDTLVVELLGTGWIKLLLNVYLCGWPVTTIGALVAANRVSDRRRSRPLSVGLLAVLAGVLWPVLAIGVVELIAIVVVARGMRAASRERGRQEHFRDEDARAGRDRAHDYQRRHRCRRTRDHKVFELACALNDVRRQRVTDNDADAVGRIDKTAAQ